MKINKELLKGSTELIVLGVLENENMYGYQMIKELKEKSENVFEFQEGTLYPILHKLEEKGWILSYWDVIGGKKENTIQLPKMGQSS